MMKLVYFAWLRSRIGLAEEHVEPPASVLTVGDLLDWLAARGPGYAQALANRRIIRVAVNQDYAAIDRALAPGDEVALFPPVTGG
jgi:molybdopterin synthase sulfur carrier subunit